MTDKSSRQKKNRLVIVLGILAAITIFVLLSLVIRFATKDDTHTEAVTTAPITVSQYGQTDDGSEVLLYTLKNKEIEVRILNYGGTITSILTPDKHGHKDDVVLGFDGFEGYSTNLPWLGSLVGRYANRIARGQFTLDGITYNLTVNDPPNSLHGGPTGFHKRIWDSKIVDDTLVLTYVSAHMEEGFPGEVNVTVTYRLTDQNAFVITFNARTTEPTIISLTSHPYFNLAGQNSGTLDQHYIRIEADSYLPIDDTAIPIGTIAPVNGTKFDLQSDTNLGTRLQQIPGGEGFNHNYVFGKSGWDKHMARIFESSTGRTLDVYSTQPGLQLYTSYFLNGTVGKAVFVYPENSAFCLEAQHYPDSPNQPGFPTTTLRPGEVYRHTIRYVFGVAEE